MGSLFDLLSLLFIRVAFVYANYWDKMDSVLISATLIVAHKKSPIDKSQINRLVVLWN